MLTSCDSQSQRHYPTTLFPQRTYLSAPLYGQDDDLLAICVRRLLMLAQFTKYTRHLPVEPDIQLNLLASELGVTDACP